MFAGCSDVRKRLKATVSDLQLNDPSFLPGLAIVQVSKQGNRTELIWVGYFYLRHYVNRKVLVAKIDNTVKPLIVNTPL